LKSELIPTFANIINNELQDFELWQKMIQF